MNPLSCGEPKEAYRLSWFPAFRNGHVITLHLADGHWLLENVDFGSGLYQQLTKDSLPLPRTSRTLTASDVERVRVELLSDNFWLAPQFRDNAGMMDGWALAIEGRSDMKYRAVTRLNVRDDFVRAACLFFQLSGTSTPPELECPKPLPTP